MYDDRGRIYKTTRYAVDPDTGTVGESLSALSWYDENGNVVKHQPAGTELLTKTEYDNLGRATKTIQGYEASGADRIFEQTEHTYDDADNLIFTEVKQRHHDVDETLTGPLGTHSSITLPRSRTSYVAHWHDHLGRLLASADYGTNGNSSLTRPALIPSRSDTILVTSKEYSDAGLLEATTDPAGIVTSFEYDALDRRITTVENEVSSGTADDENRTTRTTYTPDGQVGTLTAENSTTGDQINTYTYGTTLLDSDIATSHLLRRTAYPDSTGTSDSVFHGYNRQGQVTRTTDQNGTVHQFDYDALGRPVEDAVTTLGTGVDGSVRRLATVYDVRGLAEKLTSHDHATAGLGNIVNEVRNEYNDFGQLVTQYQEHGGAVNTSTSPTVQYAYTDGSNDHIRLTGLTYPDGRQVTYSYGSYANSRFNRVQSIQYQSNPAKTVDYEYLGVGRPVVVTHGTYEPRLSYHSIATVSSEDMAVYDGFDRFGRVIDHRWDENGTDRVRIKYGYDRVSNRTYREDSVASTNAWDELYDYDGLHRLQSMQRGNLNGTFDAVSGKTFGQDWSLDPLGNWSGFNEDSNGDGTNDLVQNRTANKANELTNITETSGPSWANPAYDANGNMTTVPQPKTPTSTYAATYDAWNRLVKLEDGANTVAEYEYDAMKRRTIAKSYAGGIPTETRHFYYSSKWQVLEERVDASTDADRQYVWGTRYIDDLILRDRDTNSDGTLDERLFALQDDNWNVVALTDDSGNVVERYAYSAYGRPEVYDASFSSRSSSSYDWETLYAGYRYDESTGLHCVRHRYLNPALGVWIGRDPIGYRDSPMLYNYCVNNSVSLRDSDGQQPQRWEYSLPEFSKAWFDKYGNSVPGRGAQNRYENFMGQLTRGCVGVTMCQMKDFRGGLSLPKLTNCYDTLEQAVNASKNKKCTFDCPPVIFSIKLWYDKNNKNHAKWFQPNKTTGKINLRRWKPFSPNNEFIKDPRTGPNDTSYTFNFDFAVRDSSTGNWWHANTGHNPRINNIMKIYESNTERWQELEYDFENVVYCFSCSKGKSLDPIGKSFRNFGSPQSP